MHMDVEWDSRKASSNLAKHGVGFEEAVSALLDPLALAQEDSDSEQEQRWVLVGMSAKGRLVTVVYTVRNEERIRFISERKAIRKEAAAYA
jgi:uncharacterized protein